MGGQKYLSICCIYKDLTLQVRTRLLAPNWQKYRTKPLLGKYFVGNSQKSHEKNIIYPDDEAISSY